jgi:cyclopropane fatty-acyl-phospholipid synthase-like methyltransferase
MGEFIDMQAEIGISKHQGGFPATKQLLGLCQIEHAREVLDVGCGIGVGPAYIARTHDCRVVGVDLSPRMIEWAQIQVFGRTKLNRLWRSREPRRTRGDGSVAG